MKELWRGHRKGVEWPLGYAVIRHCFEVPSTMHLEVACSFTSYVAQHKALVLLSLILILTRLCYLVRGFIAFLSYRLSLGTQEVALAQWQVMSFRDHGQSWYIRAVLVLFRSIRLWLSYVV